MKTISSFTLALFLVVLAASGQPQTNEYPAEAAQSAGAFFRSVSSNVLDQISQGTKKDTLNWKDLEVITSALDDAASTVRDAHWDEKLASAAAQIETVRSRVLGTCADPGNKEAMALEADAQSWLRDIRLKRASASILQTNILRLRNTVEELRKCSLILEPIEPPARLSERLRRRLQEILDEWQRDLAAATENMPAASPDTAQAAPRPAQTPAGGDHPGMLPLQVSTSQDKTAGSVSHADRESVVAAYIPPGAARVLKMAQAGVEERIILGFIAASRDAFSLTADEVIQLRRKGVSDKVVVAMLQRDAVLRGQPTERRWLR
jgi:hypothetical protein